MVLSRTATKHDEMSSFYMPLLTGQIVKYKIKLTGLKMMSLRMVVKGMPLVDSCKEDVKTKSANLQIVSFAKVCCRFHEQ